MRGRLLLSFILLSSLLAYGQGDPPGSAPSSASENSRADTPQPAAHPTLPDLTPDATGALSQAQMQELFRVVGDKDRENQKRLRDYTYIEHEVQNKLDGQGQTKSAEVKTYEILVIYGEQVQRLIAKDDKALDAKEAAKEEEKIQKIIDKRKDESEDDRRKREEKEEKEREDGRKFVNEVADAYNFKLVGTELVEGPGAWGIAGDARRGLR